MRKLRELRVRVIGDVSWRPPAWLRAAFARPRKSGLILLAALLALGGGWWTCAWYQHRPQPRKVTVRVEAPGVTPLDKVLTPRPLCLHFSESAANLSDVRAGTRGPLHGSPRRHLGTAGSSTPPVVTGVRIEPAIPGTWRWASDSNLVFTPKKDWPADQKYRVTLEKSAVAPHVLLASSRLDFATPPFVANFKKIEFYQDPTNPAVKQVVSTFEFTHAIAEGELEKHISLTMLGGAAVFKQTDKQPFAVTFGLHHRVAYVRSLPLALPEREDFMRVTLGKGLPTTQGGAVTKTESIQKIRIPDLYSFFKIDSLKGTIARTEKGDPEQVIVIETSAQAKTDELAKAFEIFLLPRKPKEPTEVSTEAEPTNDEAADNNDEDGDEQSDSEKPVEPEIQWKSPREVDEDVLKKATPVKFSVVPSEEENSKQHTFKIALESDGDLYLRLRKGVRALGGFALGADYDSVIPVPALPQEIAIQGEGGVLALSGERKLSIKSRGVPVIEYQIARVPAEQINHLVSQTEGEFQNPEFISSNFDEENIARIATEKQPIKIENAFRANFSTFDFSSHLRAANDGGSPLQGLFFLKARGWNPTTKKYLRNVSTERFILVTDTGLLVKANGDGSRDVFLQSLQTRMPLGGVAVDILAKNGVVSLSGTTSADGRVSLASLGKAAREKEPVAIVARHGSDVAFIPFSRKDRRLDFSRFDVDGVESTAGNELDAFVFTERGVYRPGDSMHIGFTVKQRDWAGQLTGLPLETEVVDARGTSVQVKKIALPAGGFAEFSYETAYESPSGEYQINVFLLRHGKRDGLLGSTSAVVKEFLPDRMKITSRLSKTTRGWVEPGEIDAFVELQNLYGTPATDRRITARLTLSPTRFCFPLFHDYTFFDRLRDGATERVSSQSVELGEKKTDENGGANFSLGLERFAGATYQATFYAEGFEADGGRSVNTDTSVLVSSLPFVVGHKTDGDLRFVKMGSERAVEFIAVDREMQKIAVENLQLNVIEQSYVSVLAKEESGNYVYKSLLKERTVKSETIAISADGLKLPLPANQPGSYNLELRDESGARVSKLTFTVVGLGSVTRSLDKNAELQVKLNRESYNAGDEIEVSITAPYTGSGLITIERDKVYAHQWFQADRTSSAQRIRVPAGFDGTGYLNVSFIRALDSKEIFMSPLSYGVVPFTANREKRHLAIELQAAKEAKPGEPLKISYRTNRPAKIIVFAVDQGILQVTDYKLPDPLQHYFRKTALAVSTSQIVDLIMPEFSLLRASAFGGDGEERHLNPFKRVTEKPVVFWSGVIDADATAREVTYDVPDFFNGTLTVMAVAISPDAVGSAEQNSIIRGPFVLTPSLPTFAAPGDRFEVPVTVANNVAGSGSDAAITLIAQPSEHLEVLQAPDQPLQVLEGRETTVVFSVRAKEKLGSGSLMFTASAGDQRVSLRATLSVRPPVAFMTEVRSGNFTKETIDLPITRVMHPEFRKLEASVSALPLGLARGLDAYLKTYPNGCSEQITSGAFCRLMIADEADFALSRAEVNAQLEKTFATLRRRQNDQGAFGYWISQDGDGGIDFISTYVMHFLIEAKAAGFAPPPDVFQSGLRHLQAMVVKEPRDLGEARTLAYAIHLLTREEVITTNYVLNLRDTLEKRWPKQWRGDLTGVYLAGTYAMLKKDDDARKLIDAYRIGVHDRAQFCDFHSALGSDSQYLAVLARHFPQMLKRISAADFQAILKPIGEGNFNTLSAAYAVVALKSYSQHLAANAPELRIVELAKNQPETALAANGKLLKQATFSHGAAALRFGAKPAPAGLGAFYQVVESGFDLRLPEKPITSGLEVYRELVDQAGQPTNTAQIGEPLLVRLKIRSLSRNTIPNVAIVDLLPGGFEVARDSLRPGSGSCGMDYVEVREDRAVFFGSVGPAMREINYQLKPCNRGEFVVPPVFAESMYDRAIKARGVVGTISVGEAK